MQIYILNAEYERIGMIDEAESVVWHKKYNDVGEAEIYTACTDEHIDLLLLDGKYLYRYDDDMFCKIEAFEITTNAEQGDYITATAADICKILSGRIIWDNFTYSGTVGGFIKKVLTENVINSTQQTRNIPNFTIDENSLDSITDEITYTTKSDDILQLIISTCKTANCGFRVSYNMNTQKLVFRLYRGENKATAQSDEYVEFSSSYANILSSHYKADESNHKTFAVVGAKDSDGSLMYITVYAGNAEPQGEERKEIYIDATSTGRDITAEELLQMFPSAKLTGTTYNITLSGVPIAVANVNGDKVTVTDFTFEKMLEIIGYNGLAERVRTQEFSGEVDTIDTYDYKTDYDLGDVVKVKNDYEISAAAQITEIWETEDSEKGYSVEPKFEYLN
jgi:hypothetical protein